MQSIKTTKSILNRLSEIDKLTKRYNKPQLILITMDKNKWLIREHYYSNNKKPIFKEMFYDDYKEYLASRNLDKNTPIIINDLPRDV